MRNIRSIRYYEELFKKWNNIFKNNDPFEDPFVESIKDRLLFYPTYGYHLSNDQYCAFVNAAKDNGDDGFFLSVTEYEGNFLVKGEHWFCEYPEYNEYLRIPLVLENALYSENGLFGIIVSHEDHAMVAGKDEFINSLKQYYNSWKDDRVRLENDWKEKLSKPVLMFTT